MDFQVTNSTGHLFSVVIIQRGDRYGLNGYYKHDKDEPLVEFYWIGKTEAERKDIIEKFGPLGQFTGGRYNSSTILEHDQQTGLALYGGIPTWSLDRDTLSEVIEEIGNLLRGFVEHGHSRDYIYSGE